ncbi:hypothetical protein M501DRAFT_1012672 [Patellaria atrata CBS 101060]|uniref:Uncharacterized protein n=1 Tax=Patellaria atrata CBS 101060 TaxID=1346257 RepID=A0A9P4SIU6_9PEZI|nr:hypothetical protein M501DRAFT_1012672 [Patellaria atrata CBS 101060]
MPSHLRLQSSFEPFSAETTRTYFPTSPSSSSSPPQKKQKMSLSQTYYVASSARTKLGKEACRADHDLRLLVGHANLLDALMVELADAEREQEAWFNETVKKAGKNEDSKHIQWVDTIVEDPEEDSDDASDVSDSDSEFDDEGFDMIVPLRRLQSPPAPIITTTELEDEDEEYYDEDDDEEHALTRVASNSPPELIHEESDSDEDLTPPTTPPQPTLEFSEKRGQVITTTEFYGSSLSASAQDSFHKDGYFIPERTAPMIANY